MATHIDLGKAGEKLATAYLINNGYTILHNNWRYARYELDLIAIKNNLLHFIEVKYRTSNLFGHPEEAVNKAKLKSIFQAIEQFLFLHPQYDNFHFDILAITHEAGKEIDYFLIEDVTK